MSANVNKKTLDDLQKVAELMGEAYLFKDEVKVEDLATTEDILSEADFEMPLGDDGVTFDVGDPDITRKKITEGRTWITFAKRGDDDISFQVPSFADPVNELFMNKVTSAAKSVKAGAGTFKGHGYSLKPKKVKGGWVFLNPEHTIAIVLPKTECYGTFKGPKGDTEGYYNVAVTPLSNSEDVEVYILHLETAGA